MKLQEMRKIQAYDDIKNYLYILENETEDRVQKSYLRNLLFDLYESEISLCGWIDDEEKRCK